MNAVQAVSQDTTVDGRYVLGDLLAVGGMAEVFLAQQQSADGAGKDVVIKRLRPELARDPRVIEMFQDEARISALLSHANNVHVYDSGMHEGLPYIAMEYIRGDELNVVCRRGIGCGEFLPLEHAVELMRQAALGMGYYHNLRDGNGRRLDVVHCDISPNNFLVGEDGYLQVIDFGIAQFRGQRYRDDQLVPGKLSYMSPEQARRERLDHRSDIFSLGVVLYEITLGQRLFRGPASEVLPRIVSCDITAPTFVRNDYPGALESIVMRALEADPSERYQEAYELADALGEYLREERMRTGAIGVARYIDRLRVAEGGECREELIAEREHDDDEALDFDRGMFSGFEAMAAADPNAAASWDDADEDESAVAEALGIDVRLVRTASRASEVQPSRRKPMPAKREEGSEPAESVATSEAPPPTAAPSELPPSKSTAPTAIVFLLLGLALGVGGAIAAGALG